jgi:carboxylesterase
MAWTPQQHKGASLRQNNEVYASFGGRNVRSRLRTVARSARIKAPGSRRSFLAYGFAMVERYPVLRGAEPWSAAGHGARGSTGLLLVHGFTGNPVSMRPLGEGLAAAGFTVEVIRLPGHGTHWRDMAKTRYTDWRHEVVRAADALRDRSAKLLLVGLSMGGTLVLDVACTQVANLAGVVAINPFILARPDPLAKLAPLIERLIPVVPAKLAGLAENDMAKPGQDEKAYPWVPIASANSLTRELPRIRQQLASLKLPALIAHSRQDHSVPPQNSREVLRLLEGGDATELVLERSYHVATLDYDLELLIEKITDFADRVDAPASTAASA